MTTLDPKLSEARAAELVRVVRLAVGNLTKLTRTSKDGLTSTVRDGSMGVKQRGARLSDAMWTAMIDLGKANGNTVSEEVRIALAHWADINAVELPEGA